VRTGPPLNNEALALPQEGARRGRSGLGAASLPRGLGEASSGSGAVAAGLWTQRGTLPRAPAVPQAGYRHC